MRRCKNRRPIFTNLRIETKQINHGKDATWKLNLKVTLLYCYDQEFWYQISQTLGNTSFKSAKMHRISYEWEGPVSQHYDLNNMCISFNQHKIGAFFIFHFQKKQHHQQKYSHRLCANCCDCVPALSTEAIKHAPRSPMSFWERSLQDIFFAVTTAREGILSTQAIRKEQDNVYTYSKNFVQFQYLQGFSWFSCDWRCLVHTVL